MLLLFTPKKCIGSFNNKYSFFSGARNHITRDGRRLSCFLDCATISSVSMYLYLTSIQDSEKEGEKIKKAEPS